MATITTAGTVARLAHGHSKSTASPKIILSFSSFTPSSSATRPLRRLTTRAAQEPSILTSIIGHVGHGKTTLNAALSIALAAFGKSYETEERRDIYKPHNALVDHPMQSDYVKNMISGAVDMAGAILVVCAVEGPTRLTEEHIWLAKLGGVPKMVVFLNKQDQLVGNNDQLLAVELKVRELLSSYEFPGDEIPIVAGSALLALEALKNKDDEAKKIIKRGENKWVDKIYMLMDEIHNYIPIPSFHELRGKKNDLPFLMPVADVFSTRGREGATVKAIGTIERGTIEPYDIVDLLSLSDTRRDIVVMGVEGGEDENTVFNGRAGDNVGLLLSGVQINDIHWGMVLAKPGTITFHRKFTAIVYVLKPEEGGGCNFACARHQRFYMATSEVNWVVNDEYENKEMKLLTKLMLDPARSMVLSGVMGKVYSIKNHKWVLESGQHAKMEIELITPVACVQGMRFAIRAIEECLKDVGVGVILDFVE